VIEAEAPGSSSAPTSVSALRLRLLLLSFLMLFTELLLIRWTAATNVYLAYFTNFVLLASFLGIGLGFLRGARGGDPLRWVPACLAGFLLFTVAFPVQVVPGGDRLIVGAFEGPALPIWLSLSLVFTGVVLVMTVIAMAVADVFARLEPLDAYRVDIGGSIAGIVAFSVMSFAGAPPFVWGLVVVAVTLAVLRPIRPAQLVALGLVLAALAPASFVGDTRWSPYYRIRASDAGDGRVSIAVNGLPHQSIVPIDELRARDAFYFDPYRHLRSTPGEVLIVGAGNGNDVAIALDQGAERVDAVEIDPQILALGRERHPARPYQDPRVTDHVDDGRAFLQRTDATYDLILFALPDSLTLVSGQGSLRLESYLFTVEALREVREHLRPGGAFAMYNYYRADVFARFAATMTEAFGHEPCIDRREERVGARQQAVLTIGREPGDIACESEAVVGANLATDDRPFPYLPGRTIPSFYLVALGLLVLVSLVLVRTVGGELRRMRPYADLFLMGVAFLLLETKHVVQFALLFGTTWFVNALVFAAVLLSVYLAVELARRIRLPRAPVLFGLLGASIVVAWLVPSAWLLQLPVAPRFVVASTIAFFPIFLANLVFAQRFRDVASSTVAFGANLLGAMIGGVLEYAALLTGYRALLLVVAAAYLGAFLLRGRVTTAT
jgi:SAM-dependent methyltransferase